jgi:hypothetical protein
LREIDHKNVIQYTIILYRLKDVVIDQKQLYLIFEYVDRDLKSYLESLGNKFMESYKIKVTIVSFRNSFIRSYRVSLTAM